MDRVLYTLIPNAGERFQLAMLLLQCKRFWILIGIGAIYHPFQRQKHSGFNFCNCSSITNGPTSHSHLPFSFNSHFSRSLLYPLSFFFSLTFLRHTLGREGKTVEKNAIQGLLNSRIRITWPFRRLQCQFSSLVKEEQSISRLEFQFHCNESDSCIIWAEDQWKLGYHLFRRLKVHLGCWYGALAWLCRCRRLVNKITH